MMGAIQVILMSSMVFLAYWFYNIEVPPGVEERFTVKLMHAAFTACRIPRFFGASYYQTCVKVLGYIPKLSPAFRATNPVRESIIAGVPVMIFDPPSLAGVKNAPALVYFHGGGFVICSPSFFEAWTDELAVEAKVKVISVDYRLAPQHNFPAAFDDCLAVTKYVTEHASEFNIDPKRIAVIGDSAGGNLAAGVAQKLKKKLKGQILIYPVLQFVNFNTSSHSQPNPLVINVDSCIWFISQYSGLDLTELRKRMAQNLHVTTAFKRSKYFGYTDCSKVFPKMSKEWQEMTGDGKECPDRLLESDDDFAKKAEEKLRDVRLSPLLADDEALRNLPQAYFLIGKYDVLRDENFLYAHRLRKLGNKVVMQFYPEGFHGFIVGKGVKVAEDANRDLFDFVLKTI